MKLLVGLLAAEVQAATLSTQGRTARWWGSEDPVCLSRRQQPAQRVPPSLPLRPPLRMHHRAHRAPSAAPIRGILGHAAPLGHTTDHPSGHTLAAVTLVTRVTQPRRRGAPPAPLAPEAWALSRAAAGPGPVLPRHPAPVQRDMHKTHTLGTRDTRKHAKRHANGVSVFRASFSTRVDPTGSSIPRRH